MSQKGETAYRLYSPKENYKGDKYFCVLCPRVPSVLYFPSKEDLVSHFRSSHFRTSQQYEKRAIDLWISRHTNYLSVINKLMKQRIRSIPDCNQILYKGCPVCECIVWAFGLGVESGSETDDLIFRKLYNDYAGNAATHINAHLKYYAYECRICYQEHEKLTKRDAQQDQEPCKTVARPQMQHHVMLRHFGTSSSSRVREDIEKSIITSKVSLLEKLTADLDQRLETEASIDELDDSNQAPQRDDNINKLSDKSTSNDSDSQSSDTVEEELMIRSNPNPNKESLEESNHNRIRKWCMENPFSQNQNSFAYTLNEASKRTDTQVDTNSRGKVKSWWINTFNQQETDVYSQNRQ